MILFLVKHFLFIILKIYKKLDCKGKLTNAWGFGGLVKLHSKELLFLLNKKWKKSVK